MTEPSTEIAARQTPAQQLVAQVRGDEFKEQIAMALPPGIAPQRFVRATVTALLEKPELAGADQSSLFAALIRCAQSGLMPDGREAAINVYRTKVKVGDREQWIHKAELLPMIGGYRKIAADYGWSLRTVVVYAEDEFEYADGLEPTLRHVPARPGVDRGERIAVYAIGKHRTEEPLIRVLYAEDVARAKKSAKTDKVWNEHTDRMWEKTAGKLLFKSLPLGSRDEDRDRLEALISDDPTEGHRAVARLYGGPSDESPLALAPAGASPPASELPATEAALDDEPFVLEAVAVEEEEAAAATGTDGAAAATSDPQPEAEPAPDGPTAEQLAAAEAAGAVKPPVSGMQEYTLAQILARPEAEKFFVWALAKDFSAVAPDFNAHVHAFCVVHFPDLLQEGAPE